MTAGLNEQNFFDNVGGGSGAPSAKLKDLNDWVQGEIVDQFMAEATVFGTKNPKLDSKGQPIQQLVVILQTTWQGWAGVAKIPLVEKDNPNSGPKPPEEDDGKRAVYVEPWTNIHAAVGAAVKEANGGQGGPLANGGTLAIKVVELKDTGKGNPLKVHKAVYTPPAPAAPSDGFFQAPPAPPAAPAAPAPPAAPAAPAAPVGDPWASPGAPQAEQPPF